MQLNKLYEWLSGRNQWSPRVQVDDLGADVSAPVPARIHDYDLFQTSPLSVVRWATSDGTLYGLEDDKIVSSTDLWETRTPVLAVPEGRGSAYDQAIIVMPSGRIIVGTSDGTVFASDPEQTSFTELFQLQGGSVRGTLGHSAWGPLALLCGYGDKNAEEPPREVYVFDDRTGTARRIYNPSIASMEDPAQHHVHTAVYDPYADRIWVSIGDGSNSKIIYSDDWHLAEPTWVTATGVGGSAFVSHQPTYLLPLEHGMVMGSDTYPDGLRYWPRPRNVARWVPDHTAIERDFYRNRTDELTFNEYATRGWSHVTPAGEYHLIPFVRSTTDGRSFLLASPDGRRWFEIFRADNTADQGFQSVTVVENGDDLVVLGVYNQASVSGYSVFRAKLPQWSS